MSSRLAANRLIVSSGHGGRGWLPPPLTLLADVVTPAEEARLAAQLDPPLRRRKYQRAHFDGVIEGYRELERPLGWFEPANRAALGRVLAAAFGPGPPPPLLPAHILELAPGAEGFIRPHVDHVGASGRTVAGLSLLSDAVMQLTHAQEPERTVWLLLRARSLYVLAGEARYEWRHEILPDLRLFPRALRTGLHDRADDKARRIAVVFRDELHAAEPSGPGARRAGAILADGSVV